jgi:exonuclease III
MQLRFASWNIHGLRNVQNMLSLLEQTECSVVALQEVVVDAFTQITMSQLFDWAVFSLKLRPPLPDEGRKRKLGCALLGKYPFRLSRFYLLPEAPIPERTLIADIETPVGFIKAGSFHAPPGVTWGQVKPQTFLAIAKWLGTQNRNVIFGMDANTPKVDHPDQEKNVWWWKEEPVLLGYRPIHNLRDVFRSYLMRNIDLFEQIKERFPQGPLAVSHMRGPTKKAIPCRYDFIYASPNIEVIKASYTYESAIAARSDHALVIADLEL